MEKVNITDIIPPAYTKGALIGMSSILMPIPLPYRIMVMLTQTMLMDIKQLDVNFLASVLMGALIGGLIKHEQPVKSYNY